MDNGSDPRLRADGLADYLDRTVLRLHEEARARADSPHAPDQALAAVLRGAADLVAYALRLRRRGL